MTVARYPLLFSPMNVGALELRNRIVMPPMVTCMEAGSDQDHAWYVGRARGGAGLIIREATPIRRLADPAFADRLKRTVDAVHEAGAAFAVQLMERGHNPDGEAIAASATDSAREATEAELLEIIDLYADAAAQCRRIGFDGVEPHGAHGFFLNQFFSREHNRRADSFGGSLERRMEMGLRVVKAVKTRVDEDCLILYRHTSKGAGYSIEDSQAFARVLQDAGVDILDVSPSSSSDAAPRADMAGALKAAVDVPVIAVGGLNEPDAAEKVLSQGRADLIAIGRGLIADAELPNKIGEGRLDEIIECVVCNEKCFGNLRRREPIGCAQNPLSGQEYVGQP
jgi:2,4-dienoyl-CoA reductase-like NADH-dependent reductase (Old Yellow Enzyme family)